MTKALGRLFDIGSVVAPIADLAAGANTGHRVHLKNCGGVAFVVLKGVASAGTDDVVVDVKEHTAATSGTSRDLDVVTTAYIKNEASLDGDETWTKLTQTAASEVTLAGATYAAHQAILVIEVDATQLSDDCEWVSVDIADPGTGGTIPGAVIAIPYDLTVQRAPENLAQLNA
ncbi:MAG: hypothetical protein EPO65_00670 [Dehalococcoidia bacterium]|nr:MAG: hypothetical protein EPO65_00670 [Dehalococcoidia bacterium]